MYDLYLGTSRRTRPLPRGLTGHVAHPGSLHSELKLTHCPARSPLSHRGFAFCLADPIGSAADFEQT
jgi:hypothetical protein